MATGRILALDYGEKRIGLAVSDPLGITAQGLPTLERGDEAKDFARLADLVAEREVASVVVGLPLTLRGTEGPKAQEVLAFVERLRASLPVPVAVWDERLTTARAHRALAEAGMKGRRRRKLVDRLAAQFILESYLTSRRQAPEAGG